MLTLSRKPGQKVYIGHHALTVVEVFTDIVTITYKNTTYEVRRGSMFKIDDQLIVCFNRKKGTEAKIQILTSLSIVRGEVYDSKRM